MALSNTKEKRILVELIEYISPPSLLSQSLNDTTLHGRSIVVDVERARTSPNWLPRRLGMCLQYVMSSSRWRSWSYKIYKGIFTSYKVFYATRKRSLCRAYKKKVMKRKLQRERERERRERRRREERPMERRRSGRDYDDYRRRDRDYYRR